MFSKRPNYYTGGGQGPSTAEIFSRYKIFLAVGDATRELKIRAFRERIKIPSDGSRPMLQIYSNCTEFLRTIPELVMDEKKIEDIDTNGEDHYYDEAALLCMYRPQAIKPERKYKSMHDRRIDELERGRVTSFEHLATIENERVLQRLWWPQEDDFGEDKVREDDRLKPTIF